MLALDSLDLEGMAELLAAELVLQHAKPVGLGADDVLKFLELWSEVLGARLGCPRPRHMEGWVYWGG
jgi:electron transfer flavoprotein alpha subunit